VARVPIQVGHSADPDDAFMFYGLATNKVQVPGLRFKAWISDEVTERWGAIYLWETVEAARAELPSQARELIGKEPDVGEDFDVEATIEGAYAVEELSRRGLAFEP